MYIYEGVGMLKRVIHSMVHDREALRNHHNTQKIIIFCRDAAIFTSCIESMPLIGVPTPTTCTCMHLHTLACTCMHLNLTLVSYYYTANPKNYVYCVRMYVHKREA